MTREEMHQLFFLETKSPLYKKILADCELLANSQANVLIIGDSGVGKDIIAQYIHACSKRHAQPFVVVNCNAYSDALQESELFGHERGAFTGALASREGRFEQAHMGTLFIDEIGDTNLATQVKLLRAIETRKIERIGSNLARHVDFRLISATNKDLAEEVQEGRMREDFFYRVSTIVIRVPTLRERREDLPALIDFFLLCAQKEAGKKITYIDPLVEHFLLNYDYVGNIREMKNIIDRMVVLAEDDEITKNGLPILYDLSRKSSKPSKQAFSEIISWKAFKRQSESAYLAWVIEQSGGNISEAARCLQLSARQLFNKIAEYDLRNK